MELVQKEETSLGLESYDVLGFNSQEELELEISKLTKFRPEFAKAFNKAVSDEGNTNRDGSIDWNFVDADLYGSEHRPKSDKEYYKLYESLAIQYDLANGLIPEFANN